MFEPHLHAMPAVTIFFFFGVGQSRLLVPPTLRRASIRRSVGRSLTRLRRTAFRGQPNHHSTPLPLRPTTTGVFRSREAADRRLRSLRSAGAEVAEWLFRKRVDWKKRGGCRWETSLVCAFTQRVEGGNAAVPLLELANCVFFALTGCGSG